MIVNQSEGEFTVKCRNSQQLTAGLFLDSPALVHVDMSCLCANDRVIGMRESRETQYIGSRSIINEIHVNIISEYLFEIFDGFFRVFVFPVGMLMSEG